jgi:hypothetical protein
MSPIYLTSPLATSLHASKVARNTFQMYSNAAWLGRFDGKVGSHWLDEPHLGLIHDLGEQLIGRR